MICYHFIHFIRNDFRMTALIESEILREVGFDPTRRNGEGDDWVFWLHFFARGFKAAFLPYPLFRYRFKSGSMSWPWSSGQMAGTLSMTREVMQILCEKQPGKSMLLALALQAHQGMNE